MGLKVGIRFSGTFQFAKACDAVRPLLDCQRRWESVEVCFDKKAEPVGGMTLNVSEFVLLKELLLHGAYWEGEVARRAGPHAEGQNVDQELLLPALRALRLFDLQRSTRMSLVAAARNLEELEISINVEERPLGPPLRLESLKKLTVVDICQDSDVLGSLQCPNLEELSLDGMVGPSFRRLRRFIHFQRCHPPDVEARHGTIQRPHTNPRRRPTLARNSRDPDSNEVPLRHRQQTDARRSHPYRAEVCQRGWNVPLLSKLGGSLPVRRP